MHLHLQLQACMLQHDLLNITWCPVLPYQRVASHPFQCRTSSGAAASRVHPGKLLRECRLKLHTHAPPHRRMPPELRPCRTACPPLLPRTPHARLPSSRRSRCGGRVGDDGAAARSTDSVATHEWRQRVPRLALKRVILRIACIRTGERVQRVRRCLPPLQVNHTAPAHAEAATVSAVYTCERTAVTAALRLLRHFSAQLLESPLRPP